MTIDELYAHLIAEGFDGLAFGYGNGISVSDFNIERDGAAFRVGQKERGRFCAIDLETQDEDEACACFLEAVLRFAWHLAHSRDEAVVERHQAILTDAGIWFHRNDLPESMNLPDHRFRLFVTGSDRKRAKQLLGL